MSRQTVHLIDDDDAVRDAVGLLLRTRGFGVKGYDSAEAFLAAAPDAEGGCVLTDFQMPRMTGIELLGRMREAGLDLPVIVMTGRAERTMADQALRRGAVAFLDKPFEPEAMLDLVRRVLDAA